MGTCRGQLWQGGSFVKKATAPDVVVDDNGDEYFRGAAAVNAPVPEWWHRVAVEQRVIADHIERERRRREQPQPNAHVFMPGADWELADEQPHNRLYMQSSTGRRQPLAGMEVKHCRKGAAFISPHLRAYLARAQAVLKYGPSRSAGFYVDVPVDPAYIRSIFMHIYRVGEDNATDYVVFNDYKGRYFITKIENIVTD